MDSMIRYFESHKYKNNIEKNYINIIKQQNNEIHQIDTFFDTRTQLGAQSLANVVIYKNFEEAQVYIKNVLNGKIIQLTDIGMSGNKNNTGHYFYTRIISYNDINFGTGLSLIFDKKISLYKNGLKTTKRIITKNKR